MAQTASRARHRRGPPSVERYHHDAARYSRAEELSEQELRDFCRELLKERLPESFEGASHRKVARTWYWDLFVIVALLGCVILLVMLPFAMRSMWLSKAMVTAGLSTGVAECAGPALALGTIHAFIGLLRLVSTSLASHRQALADDKAHSLGCLMTIAIGKDLPAGAGKRDG